MFVAIQQIYSVAGRDSQMAAIVKSAGCAGGGSRKTGGGVTESCRATGVMDLN